jgi:class 3 adenylate cyclase
MIEVEILNAIDDHSRFLVGSDALVVFKAADVVASFHEAAPAWRKRGHDLDLGIGIALGYATCGEVGFEGRSDYAAIGAVTNLASRLADEATAGQVLISQRLHAAVEEDVDVDPIGELTLKGFRKPILAFNVIAVREPAANASALRGS